MRVIAQHAGLNKVALKCGAGGAQVARLAIRTGMTTSHDRKISL